MFQKTVRVSQIELHFSDTARTGAQARFRALEPWLQAFLMAAQDFLWGKGQECCALPKPSRNQSWHLALTLCGDHRMRTLNFNYRQKNKTTDVLSFQYFDDLSELASQVGQFEVHLGDIFISRQVTAVQARQYKLSFNEEFLHLLVHGFLHVLNFDHERSEAEEREMERKEAWLIKRAGQHLKQKR